MTAPVGAPKYAVNDRVRVQDRSSSGTVVEVQWTCLWSYKVRCDDEVGPSLAVVYAPENYIEPEEGTC